MTTQTIFRTVGATSQSVDVSLVQNAASTAAGDPVLGLAFNTSNLVAFYRINGTGTATSISLVTQTVGGAYSSGGFVKISDTNMPGQYRFDIPNAVLASAGQAYVTFSGIPAGTAGNMETHTVHIIVTAVDFYSTDLGLTETAEAYAGKTGQSKLASMIRLMLQTMLNSTWTPGSTTGTLSAIKQDGSTVAATSTGNDPVNPTSLSRAT